MPRSSCVLVALALALWTAPATASAGRQVRYIGIHPLPKAEGGGICYIEGPHVHVYDADKVQYRDHRGARYFVGDSEPDDEYCYLSGPHYHYFAPPEGPEFQLAGGAYFFVGEPPHAYVEARPALMKINAVYQPLVYERPVVTVDAPVGWIGARAEFAVPAVVVAPPPAPVVVAPTVVAPAAGICIDAHVPMPSVHVDIGIGAPAVIVHERPVIIEERVRVKHDHGRHRGHR